MTKKCFKTKIMIIINKSFVLERSRIIFFFFCIINAIVHFRSSQPIFNMWFSDFPKKDKYVFWKFKQMTIFEVMVFHKDSSSNADSISSSEKTGRVISFELRHPYSGRDNCHAHVLFNAIFFYFYPSFRTGL